MHISAGSALPRCTGPSWVVAVKFWQLGHSSPEWSPQSTVLVQDTHVSRFCRLPQTAHASAARTGTAAFGAAHDGNTTGDVSLLVSSQWERFQGDWRALCRIKKWPLTKPNHPNISPTQWRNDETIPSSCTACFSTQ